MVDPAITVTIGPAVVGGIAVIVVASASALIWVGRLSSRISRVETDVKDLKNDQQGTRDTLNQHVGYHQGLSGVAATLNRRETGGSASQVRSDLGEA